MGRSKLKPPWSALRRNRDREDRNEVVFHLLFERQPEIAERETRTITLVDADPPIPAGEYAFAEAFCAGKKCDCRRVMFFVYRRDLESANSTPEHVTTIGYGWEPLSFYVNWMHGDREGAEFARGPIIEPNSPPCGYGPKLLRMFEATCLSSKDYVDRVRRHYDLFKRG